MSNMFIPTIGLEIHIELNTKSKMFCLCPNDSAEKEPNKNICPICTAQPGALPAINKEAIRKVVKTALALNCVVESKSFFERKNYFYPDLPKGYQISQYKAPLSRGGYLNVKISDDGDDGDVKKSKFQISNFKNKRVGITRIHLEEDTGRLVHPESVNYSLVDFNRAGVPLMELVTDPDIASVEEATEFIKELQLILRYLGVSRADMEKGEMRAEVNISLMDTNLGANSANIRDISNQICLNSRLLGTKVEIKNLNSIRAVGKSIEYEIKRQSEILVRGEKIVQETRGFNDVKQITFSQREKEEAHDYRYFPEPDLPPVELSSDFIEKIKAEIPELPEYKRERFFMEYGLSSREAEIYISQKDLGEYFEKSVSELREWVSSKQQKEIKEEEFKKIIKIASNYISTDLQAMLKGQDFQEEKLLISPENFAEFIAMIYKGEISSRIAKEVLLEMFDTAKDPSQIIEEKGLVMVSDAGEIEKAVRGAIEKNLKAVEDYKKGKQASFQFLIGQVMSQTKGKAKPEVVAEILKRILG